MDDPADSPKVKRPRIDAALCDSSQTTMDESLKAELGRSPEKIQGAETQALSFQGLKDITNLTVEIGHDIHQANSSPEPNDEVSSLSPKNEVVVPVPATDYPSQSCLRSLQHDQSTFPDVVHQAIQKFSISSLCSQDVSAFNAIKVLASQWRDGSLEMGVSLGFVAAWIESFLKESEAVEARWSNDLSQSDYAFWKEFPILGLSLARRSGQTNGTLMVVSHAAVDESEDTNPLSQFFLAWTKLTLFFLELDLKSLRAEEDESRALSPRYLESIRYFIDPDVEFWNSTVAFAQQDSVMGIAMQIGMLVMRVGPRINDIADLVIALMNQKQKPVGPSEHLFLLQIPLLIAQYLSSNQAIEAGFSLTSLPKDVLYTFKAVEGHLQKLITAQSALLSLGQCQDLVRFLSGLLVSLVWVAEDFVQPMFEERHLLTSNLSITESACLLQLSWVFEIWGKCIMHGRMEIRAQGAEALSNECNLIRKRALMTDDIRSNSVIRASLADVIHRIGLVKYIVGPQSHPQIIQRAHHIYAYLAAENRLNPDDIRFIWTAIIACEVSQTRESLLQMSKLLFPECSTQILLQFMIQGLGTDNKKIDFNILRLSQVLIESLEAACVSQHLTAHQKAQSLPVTVYEFCLKIIECSRLLDTSDQTTSVESWTRRAFTNLLNHGPDVCEREQLFDVYLDRTRNQTLSDAVRLFAVGQLLKAETPAHVARLLTTSRLKAEIMDPSETTEPPTVVGAEDQPDSMDERLAALRCRLDILEQIIKSVPDCISQADAPVLLNGLIGSEALNATARDAAWQSLIRISEIAPAATPILQVCRKEYLQSLDPQYFTPTMLSFIRNSSLRSSKSSNAAGNSTDDHGESVEELLWQISFAIPDSETAMEHQALDMLIDHYELLQKVQSPGQISAPQQALIDKCVGLLANKAKNEVSNISDRTSGDEKSYLKQDLSADSRACAKALRILEILRERSHKSQNQPIEIREASRPSVLIRYQSYPLQGPSTPIKSVEIGVDESVSYFLGIIRTLTGFDSFSASSRGTVLNLDALKSLQIRDAEFPRHGLLQIQEQKPQDTLPSFPLSAHRFEQAISVHFDVLYNLLFYEENLAAQIFAFLVKLSVAVAQASEVDMSENMTGPAPSLYALLYAIHYRVETLRQEDEVGVAIPADLPKLIDQIVADISKFDVSSNSQKSRVFFYRQVVNAFHFLLINFQSPSLADCADSEQASTLQRANGLLEICLNIAAETEPDLQQNALNLIYHAARRIASFRSVFQTATCFEHIVSITLFNNSGISQKLIVELLDEMVVAIDPEPASNDDALSRIWLQLEKLYHRIWDNANSCYVYFHICNSVLEKMRLRLDCSLDISAMVARWFEALIGDERICTSIAKTASDADILDANVMIMRPVVEQIVFGHLQLILSGLNWLRELDRDVPLSIDMVKSFSKRFYFLEAGSEYSAAFLHASTRVLFFNVLENLLGNLNISQELIRLLLRYSNFTETPYSWQWGLMQRNDTPGLETNWSIDRQKILRGAGGYPGLRNLSNTCYMNSLIAQLFMNADFRRCLLSFDCGRKDQDLKLLQETQALILGLQHTVLKAVDTDSFASAVINYDNTPIDIAYQVDVDEFFNLIFDRLENLIPAGAARDSFRKVFGGQIIQQIKSKECPHISERLEAFSAIQCEIAGKKDLVESLKAYVQGESMAGDNKYSCTACGRYVDAVKRACLKDVPDNMIFHLKRFDYDLMNGTRKKINDRFEFPNEIDLAPYTLSSLQDSRTSISPDVFELCGILVHSGTADSGHYYSYIREGDNSAFQTWVEFNDLDVTPFDPHDITKATFGGVVDAEAGVESQKKPWNAYMLFYRRVTEGHTSIKELSTPLPPYVQQLYHDIQAQNQSCLQRYCFFDLCHGKFLEAVLRHAVSVTPNEQDTTEMIRGAVKLNMDYFVFVLSKISHDHDSLKLLVTFEQLSFREPRLRESAITYLRDYNGRLEIILGCPQIKYRQIFCKLITGLMRTFRDERPQDYGLVENTSTIQELTFPETTFSQFMMHLQDVWANLDSILKTWNEFFGMLVDIVRFGQEEGDAFLRLGIFQKCLLVLLCDHPKLSKLARERPLATISKAFAKRRNIDITNLIELISITLENESLKWTNSLHEEQNSPDMLLSSADMASIKLASVEYPEASYFLEKLLYSGQNMSAVQNIVKSMTIAHPQTGLHDLVDKTVRSGLNIDPAHLAKPFLMAALTFCEFTANKAAAEALMMTIAEDVRSIGETGGLEYLEFFRKALRIRNTSVGGHENFILLSITAKAYLWAPTLLIYQEDEVRKGTLELLSLLFFNLDSSLLDDSELVDAISSSGRRLCVQCENLCQRLVRQDMPLGIVTDYLFKAMQACMDTYFERHVEEDHVFCQTTSAVMEQLETSVPDYSEEALSDPSNKSETSSSGSEWSGSADGSGLDE